MAGHFRFLGFSRHMASDLYRNSGNLCISGSPVRELQNLCESGQLNQIGLSKREPMKVVR